MRILVLQHIDVEHPGIFRDFLAEDGFAWDAVALDAGAPIPPFDGYDMLWVMGGPMDVWEEDAYPWLAAEKAAIAEWVATGKPFLGICLGHQLLAASLGGKVAPSAQPEIGVMPVSLTGAGRADPLFKRFPAVPLSLQWHGSEVVEPPPGAVVLAQSPLCPVQAIRVGERAYGLQFHVEATAATVREWGGVPAYAEALEREMGVGGLAQFEAELAKVLFSLNAAARRLYDNLMGAVRGELD
ncbi:MAG: type 1 glutamine amidotransferase [Alphaproteobacteria bacterium]|nr:type 1 glutamine amidotransferase [Alphaproteobacteria bacterium]